MRARSSVGRKTRGRPESGMSVARSVADVLRDHVVLELEAIDRMYLNVYVPHLQTVGAVVGYLRVHRGQRFASTTAVVTMSEAFVRNIEQFVDDEAIDLVSFEKRERKDDVTQRYLRSFRKREGVLYVGKAQEKARVMRTERRRSRVVPSLHVDYKKSRIKQYHKEGQALRTETTINDTRDFTIGRRIENLQDLRKVGFAANRRLLDVQRIGHDCFIGEASFQDLQRPVTVDGQ